MPVVNPGIRRLLASAIQRLFNSASFVAPLTHSATPVRAASGTTATFTRATTATVRDNEGVLRTVPAGCARFEGARFVRNLQATSSEPTSGWTAAGATPPTVTYTTLDGTGAVSMAFPVVAAGFANSRCTGPLTSVSWVQNSTKIATRLVASLSRPLTGTEALTLYLSGASALDDVFVFNASNTPTTATLQTAIDTFVNPSFTGTMGVIVYVSGAIVGSPVTLSLTRIQWQDITGRADQTTPSEYVSVGVLSAPYHGSMVDGVKCFDTDINGAAIPSTTLLGYLAEGARTNLCLQSNAFTTTPWGATGTPAATQNVVGPDGGTTGWTLTDNDAGTPEGLLQTYGALTAANYAQSVFIKKTSGATSFPVIRLNEPVTPKEALCTVDTNNGVATVWTAYTGSTIVASSASCVSHNADWWRVTLVFAATTASWRIIFYPSATTNATQSTGTVSATVTGTCGIYGSQLELGSFASSYIPTTTIAVARNADVLTYSSAGNIDGTKGWCYAEVNSYPFDTTMNHYVIADSTINRTPLYVNSSNAVANFDGTNNSIQTATAVNTGTVAKIASTFGGTTINSATKGTVGVATAFDGDFNFGANIEIGNTGVTAGVEYYGTIRNLRIGKRALSSSELGAITA